MRAGFCGASTVIGVRMMMKLISRALLMGFVATAVLNVSPVSAQSKRDQATRGEDRKGPGGDRRVGRDDNWRYGYGKRYGYNYDNWRYRRYYPYNSPGLSFGFRSYDPLWYDTPSLTYRIAPRRYLGNNHVDWCSNRYRSYNVRTNTWLSYSGDRRECISPYS
jgi:BA14K-like protein